MRTHPIAATAVVFIFGIGLTACSDSTGPGTASDMTPAQAAHVAEAVAGQTGTVGFGGTRGTAAADLAPRDGEAARTASIDAEADCPDGGEARFSGELSTGEGEARVRLEGELAYDECSRTRRDTTVTLTTRPVFDLTGEARLVSRTELSMDSGLSGPFDWQIEEESGSCTLDLDTSLTVTGSGDGGSATVAGTVAGRVCGQTVERSFEATVSS